MIDKEGEQVGVLSNDKALEMAADSGLDLVEISPNTEPPVCKVIDDVGGAHGTVIIGPRHADSLCPCVFPVDSLGHIPIALFCLCVERRNALAV